MRRFGVERGEGNAVLGASYTEAVFANGTGDFARAVRAARWEHANALQATAFYGQLLGELAEAAARTGELELAQWAADELEAGLGGLSTAWARGGVAEARAQVLAGTAAEAAHQEAIDRFEHGGLTVYAARARLTFGEWLRRRQRLADAREQLRAAHLELSRAGAIGFATRAARELQAAGEATYASTLGTGAELTSHERNVVRLARDGLTNRDIAAHLFVSERTVEYHLRKVFQKLGIRSRRELQGALEPAR
jgi:ATP/maltotriose-dependent transcriptional regulator MalT